jgi:hypothetical protein
MAAVAALVMIPLALVPIYQTWTARVAAERETVELRTRRYPGDYRIAIKHVGALQWPGTMTAFWEVLLANNGEKTISVIGYEVLRSHGDRGESFYSGIDQGLVDAKTLQPESLPIRLDAGDSRRFLLKVGVIPSASAYPRLVREAARGRRSSYQRVERLLAAEGIDLYGNPVDPRVENGTVQGWALRDTRRQQVFVVRFRTARGSVAREITSWYDLEKF